MLEVSERSEASLLEDENTSKYQINQINIIFNSLARSSPPDPLKMRTISLGSAQSCDSPKSLPIFTSTRNGPSFWSGVASSIANEFKEEGKRDFHFCEARLKLTHHHHDTNDAVGSGITIDISIDNDLKAEAEAEAEAAQGSSGAFANSELERRKFKRNLYTAVAL